MSKVVARCRVSFPCRQVILGAITGEGGILFYISKGITEGVLGDVTDVTFTSPTKFIVSPLTAPWFRFIQRLAKCALTSRHLHAFHYHSLGFVVVSW